MEKQGFVHIMASGRNGTIYIGATSDLPKRIWEHRNGVVEGLHQEAWLPSAGPVRGL